MLKTSLALITLFLILSGFSSSQAGVVHSDDIIGVWMVETDEEATEHIEIYERDGLYFGKIVWAKSPEGTTNPALDLKNKKEDLRSRPLVGLEIIRDYRFDGEDSWQDGQFYAYKKGKTASPKLTLVDSDHLKIQVKILLIKKTFVWPRLKQVSQETPQNPDKTGPGAPSDPILSQPEDQ